MNLQVVPLPKGEGTSFLAPFSLGKRAGDEGNSSLHSATSCQYFSNENCIQSKAHSHKETIAPSATTRDYCPELPWSKMSGMRNVLAHNYFEIDLELVWAAIEEDLPTLKHNVETILQTPS